ncbi:group I truncated hemoglobin [Hymenobacter jejuensis]|uniref:Group 1 truncated hemoglobin n=1 Tax=Hymenobacter jejuensis TaxID=2502781 RepID=A0A5B7ZWZ3_9BACT|nr:group 1 truncated hemoglobin [Hymenobacter jejuensis]QDA59508.1 group 1 truncated hemoglobin [Hymenobacter jejuensis]
MQQLRLSLALLAVTLFLFSCGHEATPAPATLYNRIGQADGIAKIVDQLIANVGAETQQTNTVMLRTHKPMLDAVSSGADPTRLQRLRNHFIDQLGEATGGPLKYTGMNMLAAHKGMMITENEFAVWRQAAVSSLATNQLPTKEKAELLAILDAMKADVVGH